MSEWWNGRHVRFRCVWSNLCGFKSHLRQIKESPHQRALFYLSGKSGRRAPKRSFLWVQRERAEAGVLLFEVIKSLKTKHGIAVTSERPRQVPSLLLHNGFVFMHCRRVLDPTCFRIVNAQTWVSLASSSAHFGFHILSLQVGLSSPTTKLIK